jgi:hypothetical protein
MPPLVASSDSLIQSVPADSSVSHRHLRATLLTVRWSSASNFEPPNGTLTRPCRGEREAQRLASAEVERLRRQQDAADREAETERRIATGATSTARVHTP